MTSTAGRDGTPETTSLCYTVTATRGPSEPLLQNREKSSNTSIENTRNTGFFLLPCKSAADFFGQHFLSQPGGPKGKNLWAGQKGRAERSAKLGQASWAEKAELSSKKRQASAWPA